MDALRKIERGSNGAKIDTLVSMAELFHVSLDYLTCGYEGEAELDGLLVGLTEPAGISGAQDGSPVFRLRLGGSKITILFSDTESKDVKERIRDILTESYEERIQRQIQESVKP